MWSTLNKESLTLQLQVGVWGFERALCFTVLFLWCQDILHQVFSKELSKKLLQEAHVSQEKSRCTPIVFIYFIQTVFYNQ